MSGDVKIPVAGRSRGFSLMELIAALLIFSVVALLGYRTVFDSISVNLDEARLSVLSALRLAQSRALTSMSAVRLSTASNSLDVRVDLDGDGVFAENERISDAGQSFPLTVAADVTISDVTITFDATGRTAASQITLTRSGQSSVISVSSTGFAN